MNRQTEAVLLAILAAALYGISSPLSKLLLVNIPPTLMAAMLYLGAGFGMLLLNVLRGFGHHVSKEANLTRKELPFLIGMVVLDIAAPVFLMIALTLTSAANASLLNNFEIVATSIIALIVFREAVGRRMWIAIVLITLASVILSIEDASSFSFSIGSLFVLLACVCWGFENNFTRMLSLKDPLQIVVIKGLGSGTGSLIVALALKQYSSNYLYLALALVLGFVAYGVSIFLYISAQRSLGAARTSAYYAVAPFIGVALSIMVFGQKMNWTFVVALLIMIAGAYFAAVEHHKHAHFHEKVTHEHRHQHQDGHHTHQHDDGFQGEHSHVHTHDEMEHVHKHTPDMHHKHTHS